MFKKVLLYFSGPGMIIYLGVLLFLHMTSEKNLIPWMIPAILVFFVVFLPVFVVEKFKYNDKKSREINPGINFSDKYKRTGQEEVNIHGKIPSIKERKEFMEK